MDNSPQQFLRVPTPTHESLSFCNANPRELKYWLDHLPKANLGETARQLYQGLIELNQLKLPVEARLQLLELFRPEVQFVCQHLERHFLNQSIVLDERPRKVANLCQALQNHLAIGYKLIVVREAPRTSRERAQLLAASIQRAIRALCGPLVRASQLYCPVPEGLWLELHQLYQLARQHGLQNIAIRDSLARQPEGLSIEQSYLVALMLGSARCNQMRQNNIARLAEALEGWTAQVRIQSADAPSTLFVIAPQVDGPPRYRTLFKESDLHSCVGVDPQPLVDQIKEYLLLPAESRAQARLKVADGITVDLLQHLAAAWGDIAERTFQRTPGQGQLIVCIGMSALHYFLAGRQNFADVLRIQLDTQVPAFKADVKDAWSGAFDAQKVNDWQPGMPLEEIEYTPHTPADGSRAIAESPSDDYPVFTLPIVNHSPGGYCLTWPKEIPNQLQAGELLGIQDTPEHSWSIAVVRWIRQVRGGGTQMGIELIAPLAQPCGLQLLRKTEQSSQYLRALLLPEISAISRPATVITPRLPFQEGNRVQINLHGEERRATLSRKITATGSFTQFEYRAQDPVAPANDKPVTAPNTRGSGGEEDFDSLWKSL
ncbi:molecular chaperone [Pseudomonas sp. ZM23]|uniref:Molecular chaperone n=1 Tax=Pseudomonas triclosanedens TaxID=2961893 RepID=A0ABY6ZW95_9PSED|nr:molecular chaperone [Pseudomonas triclosanedens]MCP8465142.1 molecular chaperone [Pseudomonas triclosanedens]MCP8470918.1 molecular chaperone [Pseudomonas triclosanedens]MCP8476442.1 molecular chaperone [Pseudomonas triclosanedens]WAI49101.1 molecular chaperone [Pseudomonas triclosanedens]